METLLNPNEITVNLHQILWSKISKEMRTRSLGAADEVSDYRPYTAATGWVLPFLLVW
jgi:hypothetical protein